MLLPTVCLYNKSPDTLRECIGVGLSGDECLFVSVHHLVVVRAVESAVHNVNALSKLHCACASAQSVLKSAEK